MQLSLDIPVARDQVLLDPIQASPALTTTSRRRRRGSGIRAKGLQQRAHPPKPGDARRGLLFPLGEGAQVRGELGVALCLERV